MQNFAEPLESRRLFALTPASPRPDTLGTIFDITERQTLLARLTLLDSTTRSTLTANLNASNVTAFDTNLLSYMRSRTTARFFWQTSSTSSLASFATSNGYNGSTQTEAANLTDSRTLNDGTGSVTLPANIDWINATSPTNSEFKHTINRHLQWKQLAQAYRYSSDAKYATELLYELADWSNDLQTASAPSTWSTTDQNSWFFDTAVRVENWTWTYFSMLDSSAWTGSANSLMLYKLVQQGDYMYTQLQSRTDWESNKTLSLARSVQFLGELFPEVDTSTTWETNGRDSLYKALGTQINPDGGHDEQTPGYASAVLEQAVEAKKLDALNGVTWSTSYTLPNGTIVNPSTLLTNGVNALWQQLSPNGMLPAISDTYRATTFDTFSEANLALGVTTWPQSKPRERDIWLFGQSAVTPYLSNLPAPALGARGNTYAMSSSGTYVLRSGSDSNARQINFDAGAKGGGHGHYDLLSFELSGYGTPLIADAGPYKYDTSASHTWAISTAAHNTIGISGLNTGELEGVSNPSIKASSITSVAGGYMVSAAHQAYQYVAGSPELARSIWFDGSDTMVIVDFAFSTRARNFEQSFLLPGQNSSRDLANGLIYSRNSGANARVQSVLSAGQTTGYQTSGIFSAGNGTATVAATRFYVSQLNATFAVFATVVTTHAGSASSAISSASWVTKPTSYGQSAVLNVNGTNITFAPPTFAATGAGGATTAAAGDIAYSSDGRLHEVFYDSTDNKLKYAVRDTNGVWSRIQTIDSKPFSGLNPSLAVDASGRPAVAYQDAASGDLKYASLSSTTNAWKVETADAKGSTGGYPSLVFSRNNTPAIAYYNRTNGDLRFALKSADTWLLSIVDSTGDVGRTPDMQLDPNRPTASKFAIVYSDSTGGGYKYAIQFQSGWRFETVDNTTPIGGGYMSLGFYDSGSSSDRYKPVTSYYDAAVGKLKMAYKTGGNEQTVWSNRVIAGGKRQGLYTQLYIDDANKINILFFDGKRNMAMKAVGTTVAGAFALSDLTPGGREIHVSRFGSTYSYSNGNVTDNTFKVFAV